MRPPPPPLPSMPPCHDDFISLRVIYFYGQEKVYERNTNFQNHIHTEDGQWMLIILKRTVREKGATQNESARNKYIL